MDFLKAIGRSLLIATGGYKGVTELQIEMYKKFRPQMSEQEALDALISSRLQVSFGRQEEALVAYGHLLVKKDKKPIDVIQAIIFYEFFDCRERREQAERAHMPFMKIAMLRDECTAYIAKRVKEEVGADE